MTIRLKPHPSTPNPQGDHRVRVVLDIDPGVADMESVGEAVMAVMALLRAGEQMAHQSRDAADRLDDVEATVVELRALVEGLE